MNFFQFNKLVNAIHLLFLQNQIVFPNSVIGSTCKLSNILTVDSDNNVLASASEFKAVIGTLKCTEIFDL